MSFVLPMNSRRESRSSAFRVICAPSEVPGYCRAMGTRRSRTTRSFWHRVFGFRTGSSARPCGATCRKCCVHCAPAPRPNRRANRIDGGMLSRVLCLAWMASALGLAACEREPEPPPPRVKQVFHLNPYEKDFGYSQAVLIDKTLYISGSVAVDQNGRLVAPGDMAGGKRGASTKILRTPARHGAG